MKRYGLIGKNISYSFSRGYFSEKFQNEDITNATYENFDLQDISEFKDLIKNNPEIKGLNVTIPYKESIIPYLDKLNKKAKKIGAVNTILINKKGLLVGYNTDYYGFKKSLEPHLKIRHKNALILGTGGASKAIAYALKKLGISYKFVSRKKTKHTLTYNDLTESIILNYQIIINCTPLGTHPNITDCPDVPYQYITDKHICYDLIYNPSETEFLKRSKKQGATIINGLQMLQLQAEKAWQIWNKT